MTKVKGYRIGELDQLRIKFLKEKFKLDSETEVLRIAIRRWFHETQEAPTEDELINEYLHEKSLD